MTSTTFFSFSLYSPSRLFTDKHKEKNLSYFRSVFDLTLFFCFTPTGFILYMICVSNAIQAVCACV